MAKVIAFGVLLFVQLAVVLPQIYGEHWYICDDVLTSLFDLQLTRITCFLCIS